MPLEHIKLVCRKLFIDLPQSVAGVALLYPQPEQRSISAAACASIKINSICSFPFVALHRAQHLVCLQSSWFWIHMFLGLLETVPGPDVPSPKKHFINHLRANICKMVKRDQRALLSPISGYLCICVSTTLAAYKYVVVQNVRVFISAWLFICMLHMWNLIALFSQPSLPNPILFARLLLNTLVGWDRERERAEKGRNVQISCVSRLNVYFAIGFL